MTVREARLTDAAAIAALTGELGYAATEQSIAERLARMIGRADQRVCVTVIDHKIAGWVQACASDALESGSRVEIVGLVVGEKFRRRGVGRVLVQEIERWSAQLGVPVIVVRSNVQRQESHLFYPALGFASVKTQAVYRKRLTAEMKNQACPTRVVEPAPSAAPVTPIQ